MNQELIILYATAASIGFLHTIFGPDHYLPFIVIGKARKWSLIRTGFLTLICGIGHIMSSVLLGFIGIALGIGVMKLEALEAFRGNIAAWALIGFGFAYFIWGLRKSMLYKSNNYTHMGHYQRDNINITPWILFIIFVLGPCEPLIPILMYPAAKQSIVGLFLVTIIFGITTIATMLIIVVLTSLGINLMPLGKLERYTHALAGATICLSGIVIQFLGL